MTTDEIKKDFDLIRRNNEHIQAIEKQNLATREKYTSLNIFQVIEYLFPDPCNIPSVYTLRKEFGRYHPLEGLIGKSYPQIMKLLLCKINGFGYCHICGEKRKAKIFTNKGFVVDVGNLLLARATPSWNSTDYFRLGENIYFLCKVHFYEWQNVFNSSEDYFTERKIETPEYDAILHRVEGSFESGKKR